MKDLPFPQACFFEAVRSRPAVLKNVKRAMRDDIIRPAGGETMVVGLPAVCIRAGEPSNWSDITMSRLTEVWNICFVKYIRAALGERRE